jgi:hypothetical protein
MLARPAAIKLIPIDWLRARAAHDAIAGSSSGEQGSANRVQFAVRFRIPG